MNRHLVTIDTGTTNTRIALWDAAGNCLDMEREDIGVRNTAIDGNSRRLAAGVKVCLERLMLKRSLGFDNIAAIYASGMITSNVGLHEVPHLIAPAGRADFVDGVVMAELPEVAPLPIHFIPGLKNMGSGITIDNVEGMDIMRGEETEIIALLDWLPAGRKYLFVLPGSHTKFITVDENGRLTGCLTSLAGEMLSLLTTQSILADAVKHQYVGEADYDPDMLVHGFRTARATSLSRAAFSTRIMGLFVAKKPADCANFLLGAVLESDVAAVKGSRALGISPESGVVVAGREPLRSALAQVFREDGYFAEVRTFAPPGDTIMSGYGAFLVAKARGELTKA